MNRFGKSLTYTRTYRPIFAHGTTLNVNLIDLTHQVSPTALGRRIYSTTASLWEHMSSCSNPQAGVLDLNYELMFKSNGFELVFRCLNPPGMERMHEHMRNTNEKGAGASCSAWIERPHRGRPGAWSPFGIRRVHSTISHTVVDVSSGRYPVTPQRRLSGSLTTLHRLMFDHLVLGASCSTTTSPFLDQR